MQDKLTVKVVNEGRQNGRPEQKQSRALYFDTKDYTLKENNPEFTPDDTYSDDQLIVFDNRWHPGIITRPAVQTAMKSLKKGEDIKEVLEQLAWEGFNLAVDEFETLVKTFSAIGVPTHYPPKYQFVLPERSGAKVKHNPNVELYHILPPIEIDEEQMKELEAKADEQQITIEDAMIQALEWYCLKSEDSAGGDKNNQVLPQAD